MTGRYTGPCVDAAARPPLHLYASDFLRSGVDYWALGASGPLLTALPRGDRHPVLVLPGFMTSDLATITLRRILRSAGYRVHGWRLGPNVGPTAGIVDGMRRRLDDLYRADGQPVSLVGWSLGGIYARDLARQAPEQVRQVITLGSPIRLARHDQSRVGWLYRQFGSVHVRELELPLEDGLPPLPVPATSIYSRIDGIVAWQACLDVPGPQSENIAVWASHFGFGHHPAVLWAIADRLAQRRGEWAPFTPPTMVRAAFPAPDTPCVLVHA